MKPKVHAEVDAKQFGGVAEDYLPIHNFFDSSKAHIGTNLHRAMLHHSFGIFIAEKVFGIDYNALNLLKEKYNLSDECVADIVKWKNHCSTYGTTFKNSKGRPIEVRTIGERHCVQDFGGFIPMPMDYLQDIPLASWMNGQGTPPSYKHVKKGLGINRD